MLVSMLHQLIIGEPETTKSLLSFKVKGRSRLFIFLSDNPQLWAAVKSALVASKRETILLGLDALDEMEPQSMLCDGRTAAHLAAMFGLSAVLALVLSTGIY